MKNFKLISFSLLAILLLFGSCRDEAKIYQDTPYLHFTKETTKSVFVDQGTGSKIVKIDYSSISSVKSNAQVKLVVDTQFSTAVEGTDFQIMNNPDDLTSGEKSGSFDIKLLESGAGATPKMIVFKLQSNSIQNANFNQIYYLSYSKKCPVSVLLGSVKNTEGWWYDTTGKNFDVVVSTVPNQLLIKNFWDVGKDLVLNYNPDNYNVTVPDQSTGVSVTQGTIWAKPSTNSNQISTFNPCTRTIELYINYYIPNVGGWGNQVEKFIGN